MVKPLIESIGTLSGSDMNKLFLLLDLRVTGMLIFTLAESPTYGRLLVKGDVSPDPNHFKTVITIKPTC
jgi:hypothetical protein